MPRFLLYSPTPYQVDRARDYWLEPDDTAGEPTTYCYECDEPLYDDIHSLPNGEDCCESCCEECKGEDDCDQYRLGDSHA